jgi:hypothetical protein
MPDHVCPGCGARQPHIPRFPWHFCNACVQRATDGSGRRVVFGNRSASRGFAWNYADAPASQASACNAVRCLINGRPALVTEARYGSVVAEPLLLKTNDPTWTDLTQL